MGSEQAIKAKQTRPLGPAKTSYRLEARGSNQWVVVEVTTRGDIVMSEKAVTTPNFLEYALPKIQAYAEPRR